MSHGWITVIDVMRALHLDCAPRVTWAVGALVRDRYAQMTGVLPTKVLRAKTNDPGTHCFAVYPDTMWPEIERIVRAHVTETTRQGELFP
jgi:hypothetical protein